MERLPTPGEVASSLLDEKQKIEERNMTKGPKPPVNTVIRYVGTDPTDAFQKVVDCGGVVLHFSSAIDVVNIWYYVPGPKIEDGWIPQVCEPLPEVTALPGEGLDEVDIELSSFFMQKNIQYGFSFFRRIAGIYWTDAIAVRLNDKFNRLASMDARGELFLDFDSRMDIYKDVIGYCALSFGSNEFWHQLISRHETGADVGGELRQHYFNFILDIKATTADPLVVAGTFPASNFLGSLKLALQDKVLDHKAFVYTCLHSLLLTIKEDKKKEK